jgi:hypothetical protein
VAKAKRARRGIFLPWERRSAWFGQLFTRRRFGVVVSAVAGVAIVLGLWGAADERSRVRATRSAITAVKQGVAEFREDMGRCPRSTVELVHPPRAGVRYLDSLPLDGWGHELYVRCPGVMNPDGVDVISAGPSGDFFVDDNVQ